jgi:hypothetical protein
MDKGETVMPVPEGNISTSAVWSETPTVEEAIEIVKEQDAELLERLEDEDDLPELS